MTTPAARIGAQISEVQRRLQAVERGPQIAHSSVNIGGEDVMVLDALAAGLQAEINAGLALDAASSAEAKADGAVVTFYGDNADRSTAKVGDFWVNSSGQASIFSPSSTWEPVTSSEVSDALAAAQSAEAAVDGKITTFFSPTAPTAEAVGDLWFDTDEGNRLYRWSGTAWANAQDTTIASAKAAADAAQAKADTALTSANDAKAIADGKVRTFFQTTAPTGMVAGDVGDLWFDTDDANKMYRYDGSAWVVSADTRISQAITDAQNAATAASNAQTTATNANTAAGTAQSTANTASTKADTAQTTANKKITTYYQTAAPTTGLTSGDLWVDTDDGNRLWRWDGTAWKDVESTRIATAQAAATAAQNRADSAMTAAQTAQTTADGKAVTYFQTAAPTGLAAGDVGDLWFDTDDGNKMYRWSGTAWVLSQDQSIAAAQTAAQNAQTAAGTAQSTADKKTTTWYQTAAPTTGLTTGDLWVDTDDSNRLYRYSGSAWVDVRDTGIAAAQTAASNAQNTANTANGTANTALTTANGKGKVWWQDTAPTASSEFDLWFQTNADNKPWKRSGGAWVAASFADGALGAINVGKLIAGTLSAQYVVIAGRLTTKTDGTQAGARVELDSAGLRAYDGNGTRTVDINANGTATFTGTVSGSTITGSNISVSGGSGRVEMGPAYDGAASLRIFESSDPNPTGRLQSRLVSGTQRAFQIQGPYENLSYVNIELNSSGRIDFNLADVYGNGGGLKAQVNTAGLGVFGTMNATVSMTSPRAKIGSNGTLFTGIASGTASGTTDANGYLNISHGLGTVTPLQVFAQIGVTSGGGFWTPTDNYSSTGFRVRVLKPGTTAGSVVAHASSAVTVEWLALAA